MDEDLVARMRDIQRRERVLEEFNASTLDDVGPLGGEQGMRVPSEMKSMADDHEQFVRSLAPRVDGLYQEGANPTST